MRPFPFDALKVINLSEVYLTREEYGRQARRMARRIKKLNLSILLLSVGIVMLGSMIVDDRARLDRLEEAKKTDETAG